LKTVMLQLSRWYDVDVEYKGNTDPICCFLARWKGFAPAAVLKIYRKAKSFQYKERTIVVGS